MTVCFLSTSSNAFWSKDPTGAKPLPAQTLARLRSLGQLYEGGAEDAGTCKLCGSALKDRPAAAAAAVRRGLGPHPVKPRGGGAAAAGADAARGGQKRKLQLEFEPAHEDQLLNRIMSLIEPGGNATDGRLFRKSRETFANLRACSQTPFRVFSEASIRFCFLHTPKKMSSSINPLNIFYETSKAIWRLQGNKLGNFNVS